jgi:hypothetical protein
VKEVEQMIYTTLANDATLTSLAPGGVWRGVAPTGTDDVFVVFNLQGEVDQYTFGVRAMLDGVYQIKAVQAGGSASGAWDAAERIDALITDQSLTCSNGTVLLARRQQIVSFTETDGGEMYQHVGGLFSLIVQED